MSWGSLVCDSKVSGNSLRCFSLMVGAGEVINVTFAMFPEQGKKAPLTTFPCGQWLPDVMATVEGVSEVRRVTKRKARGGGAGLSSHEVLRKC